MNADSDWGEPWSPVEQVAALLVEQAEGDNEPMEESQAAGGAKDANGRLPGRPKRRQ